VVEEALLVKRLGYSAWHTWQVLARKRDRKGITHITTLGITACRGFTPIAEHKVRLALRVLVRVGMVENLGWRWVRVPVPGGRKSLRVFVRCVHGARLLTTEKGKLEVIVPREVKEWLMNSTRGGKRKGAGRPKKIRAVERLAEVIRLADYRPAEAQVEASSSAGLNTERIASFGNQTRAARNQTRAARTEIKPALAISITTKRTVRSASLGRDSSKEETRRSAGGEGFSSSLETEVDGVGSMLSGTINKNPIMLNSVLANVPPYPGRSIVAAADVPPPQKITPDLDDANRVKLLAAFYRGAVEKQYGKRLHALKNISPRAPSWGVLVKAAKLLEDYDIPPAAWCMWIVRRWYSIKTHTNGWKEGMPVPLPPVNFVFSTSQIEKRCADPEDRYVVLDSAQGGRVVFGKTHKLLLKRYTNMRAELNRGADRAATVKKFFPGTAFEEMVDAARGESMELRSRMESDMKLGRMIW